MEHLVVGVDGSIGADRALAWTIRQARLWNARLTIVHCYPLLPIGGPWMAEEEESALRAVEALVARHTAELESVQWDTQVRWAPSGSWAHRLVDAAEDADVLVVGSRGLGGFLQLLLGSVSHHVSIHAPSSVAVVHEGTDATRDRPPWWSGSTARPRRCGHWRGRRARPTGSVSPWRRSTPTRYRRPLQTPRSGRGTVEAEEIRSPAHSAAEELLKAAVAQADVPETVEVRQRVAAGSPAGVLIDAAGSEALLVCGQRGHGRLGQLVIGSVSDQCLRHATGAVVVVRPTRIPA